MMKVGRIVSSLYLLISLQQVLAFTSINPSSSLRKSFSLKQSSRGYEFVGSRPPTVLPSGSSETRKSTNILSSFSAGYSRLTSEHYLFMAFIQAGCLASGADIATQAMEHGGHQIDFGHVASMASIASTMSGAMNAVWLRQLEQAFPGTETKEVASKTLIHAVILASIINSAYLVGVPLFHEYFYSGAFELPPANPAIIFQGWSLEEFITLTKLEVLMFIPYNTLAFKYVPPQIRPLTHAAISATFNIAVSAITLGYFNSWCDNVARLFQ